MIAEELKKLEDEMDGKNGPRITMLHQFDQKC